MDTLDSTQQESEAAQNSMSQIKQQSINETLKELQKLQYKQANILARIDCIDRLSKRNLNTGTKKEYKEVGTQTFGPQFEEDVVRAIEEKYNAQIKQLENILQAERQFREVEFAGNFEKHMEALKF